MSLSNPTSSKTPNPCTRWHDWRGGKDGGTVEYYNRETKERVDIGGKFTFIVLEELSCVRGWHDASDSGIISNEVRDTKAEPMVVRAHKGGTLAEGLYSQIRDRIAAHGGHYVANIYCAFKDGAELKLGSVQFKGAALNAWVEFKKASGAQYDAAAAFGKKGVAIAITGFTEGKKGSITYRVPVFKTVSITPESLAAASKIDAEILQPYLAEYFRKSKVEQAAPEVAAPELNQDAIADAIVEEQQRAELPADGSDEVPF